MWVDTEQYASKKKPELMLKDMDDKTLNGKVESGKSPFVKEEFIRMDG